MINVIVKESFGEKRITGWVDDNNVIVIGLHTTRQPTVMMSSCLPSDIEMAEEYVNCMKMAFTKYKRITFTR